jgi:dTDP-4-amino-4,6-dideoxygalactose transaminase
MELKKVNFGVVTEFEEKLAQFFGAPYAIAVDSCTHGIELCLRYTNAKSIECPKRTYLSVPFLANKLNIDLKWRDEDWVDYYYVTENIIDAAVLWKKDSYIPGTFMNVSFQFQKHLNVGRGGVILTDNKEAALELKKMSYDGRLPNIPWREQDIDTFGYHYYMTPETAQLGLSILEDRINSTPRQWVVSDWPDLTEMKIFNK